MLAVWKGIKNFDKYEVSNFGEIRSFHKSKTPRLLKLQKTNFGYLQVALCSDIQKRELVHAIVAESFIGKRQKGFQINHKNGIKTDNRVENLEYVSPKENMKHASENKLNNFGENHGKAKLNESQVLEIYSRFNQGEKAIHLSKIYGVSASHIRKIGIGQNWRHLFN